MAQAFSHCGAVVAEVVRAFSHPEERETLQLTACDGAPWHPSLARLSVLARPHGQVLPAENSDATRLESELPRAPDPAVQSLDRGLLPRLAALAQRWPARRILIVSGLRPRARRHSRHRVGRALDIIVEGIDRHAVSEFARALDATGVGYYPNSTFTHIDVRRRSAYWIDSSGPGERPRYVRDAGRRVAQEVVASTESTRRPQTAITDTQADHMIAATMANTVEANTVEANTVEADTVEANTVEANTVEANTVEANTVEANTVEANAVADMPAEPPLSLAEVAALRRGALRALEDALRRALIETAMQGEAPRNQ